MILGATGGTGLQVVRKAIERGHSVTAFVRSPDRLKPFCDSVTVRQGNLLNIEELAEAIKGHDAILSGFGPRLPIAKSDHDLLHRFALALTSAMHRAKLRRLVVESSAFLFKDSIVPPTYLLGRLFFSGVVKDATAMEQVLFESGLDWTIVRPPRLTDDPYTGRYRVREGHLPRFGFTISRADVADSFIKSAETHAHIQRLIGISN
ncbi:SDR family oxidoreductase [Edaphobacter sp.]|uniref:NAD(P)-dependent oxidoreductase n=1 Tax=Edaphobacter sp. TaxID=1934404 RepID=UPI002D7EC5C0|nr:SDR family oxidoreductase [Edaphobacter sp.]